MMNGQGRLVRLNRYVSTTEQNCCVWNANDKRISCSRTERIPPIGEIGAKCVECVCHKRGQWLSIEYSIIEKYSPLYRAISVWSGDMYSFRQYWWLWTLLYHIVADLFVPCQCKMSISFPHAPCTLSPYFIWSYDHVMAFFMKIYGSLEKSPKFAVKSTIIWPSKVTG